MARFRKIETLSVMFETGLVPVFYSGDLRLSLLVAKACYDGGVRVFEFTNRGDAAQDVFHELAGYIKEACPDLILGAGSIVDAATAAIYIQMGANFIVGPLFNPDVAKLCNRRQIPYIPGCGTVTEIGFAQEAGCDVCKIFPAGCVGGASFVKNIKEPMPWTQIMATGAVEPTEESLSEWFRAGVNCVGMGSKLLPKDAMASENWDGISQLCQKTLSIIQKYK